MIMICVFIYLFCYQFDGAADLTHTTQNGYNKWIKILTLERTTYFWLKMMVKSGLDFFYFEIHRPPSEIPANLPGQFSLSGQILLHWAAATLKGLGEF